MQKLLAFLRKSIHLYSMLKILKHNKDLGCHQELGCKTMIFPGGEMGVTLNTEDILYLTTNATHQTIIARLQTANDIMVLALTVDALRRIDRTPIRLFMPYVPYARQDRACNKGEALSLKVFCDMINAMNFDWVAVCDPHSDVVGALLNRVTIINQARIISNFDALNKRIFETNAQFVSPDAGANKKTADLAAFYGRESFIRADKVRELSTGKIKETIVYANDLTGQTIIIVDDICDGGRTFIELATVLKAKGAKRVILYVTHGIFSKGLAPIIAGGVDEIYTTNSYTTCTGSTPAADLEDLFRTLL